MADQNEIGSQILWLGGCRRVPRQERINLHAFSGRIELPGRGHKLGALMIRNVAELEISTSAAPVKIPASPAALEAISGRTLKYRI